MSTSLARIIPERLREAREARGFTVPSLADRLGVSRQAVAQFEVGQSQPSPETLANIIAILNQPPAFFTTSRAPARENAGTVFWRSLKRMKKHERDRIARRLDWAQDIVSYVSDFVELPPVNLPAPDSEIQDEDSIEQAADLVRKIWGLGRGPIPDMVGLLESNGIVVIREPLHSDDMDAVSRWQCGRPFVLLSADKNSAARSRFDAAHELGHMVLHADVEIDSRNLAKIEAEANRFAGAFLLPADSFSREVTSSSIDHFISLKRRWNVAIAAMVYRCKDLGIFSQNQIQYLWRQRSARRWIKCEPLDDELEPEVPKFLAYAIRMLLVNEIQNKQDLQDKLLLSSDDIESLCGLEDGILNPTVVPLHIRPRADLSREIG
jgi:Zn-dependent peptidase ImmA (M78 family)/DNA-binding XRE family transcriptional regulator